MINRDSWIWLIGFLAAAIGYLITAQTPPTAWTYMQWLQALAFVLAYIVGRMSSSPLAGKDTHVSETRPALGGLFSVKE